MINWIIYNAIQKGLNEALSNLSIDDFDGYDFNSSADTDDHEEIKKVSGKEENQLYKYNHAQVGDCVYVLSKKKGYRIIPAKHPGRKGHNFIGYCCASADMMPDHKPRFIWWDKCPNKERWTSNTEFSHDSLIYNLPEGSKSGEDAMIDLDGAKATNNLYAAAEIFLSDNNLTKRSLCKHYPIFKFKKALPISSVSDFPEGELDLGTSCSGLKPEYKWIEDDLYIPTCEELMSCKKFINGYKKDAWQVEQWIWTSSIRTEDQVYAVLPYKSAPFSLTGKIITNQHYIWPFINITPDKLI